ncbi:TetR/AcrR family transcriptional regulator [Zoogloea sp.]|uniref:TetR/AcrR family transcriptional regulator n=1 Tax=Zoogloea sp. TaxID=49181 RepID=UPI0035AF7C4D
MNTQTYAQQEQPRAEARKAQVLNAATECFRRQGFHGASMAQISKAAGMSVGHIYHYFENKEAIIAAIVERDLLNLLTITQRIRAASADGDILRAMVDDIQNCTEELNNDQDAPLMLEIISEAARNPDVATIVQTADRTARERLVELVREGLAFRGVSCTDSQMEGPLEVLYAVFEGLTVRMIRNPDLDPHILLPSLRSVLEHILEELIFKTARTAAVETA